MTDLPAPRSSRDQPLAPAPAAVERVVDLLRRHYAADELTESDFENRLERAYAAATLADLQGVVADLAPLATELARPAPITAFMSGQERNVTGLVPGDLAVRARLGYVELDLTEASFPPGVTVLDLRATMGYIQVRLPAGVRVESSGSGMMGFFALKGARGAAADSPATVRITGRALMGFVECVVSSKRRLPKSP